MLRKLREYQLAQVHRCSRRVNSSQDRDNKVKQRIADITPQDYMRMGVAIRHLTKLLNEVDAGTRLLVTLSDGKPDDYSDHYRGETASRTGGRH